MKKFSIYIIAIILVLSNLFVVSEVSAASSLDQTVKSNLGTKNISVSLRSLQTGNVLYEYNGDFGVKPASTLKLLTAATALDVLGPNYRFKTEVYVDGNIENNVLQGDLYIKGGGDPTLQKENFLTFAVALKRNGIRTITGNVYGDDYAFVGSQLTPGIYPEDESYYYAPRITALTMSPNDDYDAGTMIVNVKPTTIGKAANYTAEPNTSGMRIVNKSKTVNRGQKNTIKIERKYRTNEIIITGSIPLGSTSREWVTLYDPTINTLHALKTTIEGTGIKFSKTASLTRKTVPSDAKLIYTKQSIPLKTIMNPFMKLSNNSIADILVKTMGREVHGEGSTENGLKVLKTYGDSIGLHMDEWSFEDGSGMSHKNKVSANELSLLLLKVRQEPNYKLFKSSLPIGGERSRLVGGSLKNRFTAPSYKNRVVAKTGSITGVYTLSGYVTGKSGRMYAFTIMTQYQPSVKINQIDTVVKKIISLY